MKRLKIFFAASVAAAAAAGSAFAQEPHSTVQVTFVTPLGTNGLRSKDYTNDFSLNLLVGVSANERAFALAGLANVIHENAQGFQFAGLGNAVGGDAQGFQFAGLANLTGGNALGLQYAGLANAVGGDALGFQFAGLANVVGGKMKGFQFGGLGNAAGDVYGFQFGGLFNKAKNVSGMQLAGLMNIADHSDYPLGLINIIQDGEMGVAAGYNEIGTASLTFRSGGRVLYGILGAGYNHRVEESKDAWSVIGGFGAHVNILPQLRINNELTVETIDCFGNDDPDTFKAGYALLPAYRPVKNLEIFAGPSINYMQTDDPAMYDLLPGGALWDKEHTRSKREQVHIGWQAGVQVLF